MTLVEDSGRTSKSLENERAGLLEEIRRVRIKIDRYLIAGANVAALEAKRDQDEARVAHIEECLRERAVANERRALAEAMPVYVMSVDEIVKQTDVSALEKGSRAEKLFRDRLLTAWRNANRDVTEELGEHEFLLARLKLEQRHRR